MVLYRTICRGYTNFLPDRILARPRDLAMLQPVPGISALVASDGFPSYLKSVYWRIALP